MVNESRNGLAVLDGNGNPVDISVPGDVPAQGFVISGTAPDELLSELHRTMAERTRIDAEQDLMIRMFAAGAGIPAGWRVQIDPDTKSYTATPVGQE